MPFRHHIHRTKILAGILTRRYAFCGPLCASVLLTRACNLSCQFCAFHAPMVARPQAEGLEPQSPHLDTGTIMGLMDDLRSLGTRELFFEGEGEPLLHPDALPILSAARRRGFWTVMSTNGTLLCDAAHGLIESGLDRLRVGIMAATPKTYVAMHGPRDHSKFESIREGVRAVLRERRRLGLQRPLVELHHVLSATNCGEIPQMVAHAAELGVDSVTFAPVAIYSCEQRALSLGPEALRATLAALAAAGIEASRLGLKHNVEAVIRRYEAGEDVHRRMRCYVGWLATRIRPNGEVIPCFNSGWVVGSVRQTRFRDLWFSPRYAEFRRRASRVGGMADPALATACSYCGYHVLHARIDAAINPFRRAK